MAVEQIWGRFGMLGGTGLCWTESEVVVVGSWKIGGHMVVRDSGDLFWEVWLVLASVTGRHQCCRWEFPFVSLSLSLFLEI